MPRCPLCKTQYPDNVGVCKIDGTSLASPESTTPVPAKAGKKGADGKGAYSVLVSGEPEAKRPAGKGGHLGLNFSGNDEVTTAAKSSALAARAKLDNNAAPPRLATGSATVAPKSNDNDEWAAPFLDDAPMGLESLSSEEWVGQTLGSYKLLSILGKGGMGCVYRAEHTKLGRDVALKVLRTDYAKRKDAVARFFQEARAVNKVRHRNIVDITDLVELDNGIVFIIMEYLTGAPLTKLMHFNELDEPVRSLAILVQICDGLAAAHSVGIVHRDLKPDNIIVIEGEGGGQDLVKLLDFGVAKLLDKSDGDDIGLKTVAGSVVGTPAFMSPEQAGGLQVDGRADLYSLGAIMYEIFTQQSVFQGKSFGDYVRMHLQDVPVRPSLTPGGKDIDPGVEDVIMRCLAKSPDARFQTAQDLRAELLALLAAIENTGELTDHLQGGAPSASPVGAARPQEYQSPPSILVPLSALNDSQRQVPYTPGVSSQEIARLPANQISTPYDGQVGSASGSQPMHGYGSDSQDFALSGQMGRGPMQTGYAQQRAGTSKTAMMIAGGICVAAILALIVVSGGSGDSDKTESQAGGVAETAVEEPATDKPSTDTPESGTALVKPTQVVTPPPVEETPKARFVSVPLTSTPTAAVHPWGAQTPVCEATPCELRIDTADGGAAARRDFVLRREGYEDEKLTINLRAPRKKVHLNLREKANPEVVGTEPDKPTTKPPIRKNLNKNRNRDNRDTRKPKCKAGAQDTFNPFGNKEPCRK